MKTRQRDSVKEIVVAKQTVRNNVCRLDRLPPSVERFSRHRARGIAAFLSPANGRTAVVAVAHHEKKQIADAKRIPLPRPTDRIAPPLWVHTGKFRVLARWSNPLAKPPLRFLTRAGGVVVARKIVKVLAPVLRRGGILTDNFEPFVVHRWSLAVGKIAYVDCDVPVEGRPAAAWSACKPDGHNCAETIAAAVDWTNCRRVM